MKQIEKNSKKKDQELTKEELEQVNGGRLFGLIPDDDHTKENIARRCNF